MIVYLLLAAAVLIGGYFAFRFYSLKSALREMEKELKMAKEDLTQNQILHTPLPDSDLEKLICLVNDTLEAVRRERQSYEKRELEFQRQIENISHDLRTPLTVILGYLGFMKQIDEKNAVKTGKGEKNTGEKSEILVIIERKARFMEKLIEQFYAFSRLNAGDYELEMQVTDIGRVLRETLLDNYQILEEANLTVEACLPEYEVPVMGDKNAFERIFSNLFQNCGRYGRDGLKISLREEEDMAVISFLNNTDAISQKDINHLFDRFYMQDDSRHQGGTGLGLTIARQLAEAMGGTLTAEIVHTASENGRDAICFSLKFKLWTSHKEYDKLSLIK